ncbi:probable NAD(P)H dehydrogenase (quinone) FQR1-like 3 [Malania oleifera]|uniref:probable NAD(P)H dehydrogenase (quinone) FQR1-like 3 n=1 Tax=Malania oleifera TaxID=397392 RepID=UPI0025AE9927|nr:probable NAD(P)H dehydrogenase (quinone) FQR1-like 3 [Malania oleifera]
MDVVGEESSGGGHGHAVSSKNKIVHGELLEHRRLQHQPEQLADDVAEIKPKQLADDVAEIKPKQLADADGFLIGFPSRFEMMPAQFKAFFDATHELWASQALAGKPTGIFWSTGFHGGGQEQPRTHRR